MCNIPRKNRITLQLPKKKALFVYKVVKVTRASGSDEIVVAYSPFEYEWLPARQVLHAKSSSHGIYACMSLSEARTLKEWFQRNMLDPLKRHAVIRAKVWGKVYFGEGDNSYTIVSASHMYIHSYKEVV